MFISIPTVRFAIERSDPLRPPPPITSMKGKNTVELIRLLEFWQDLPSLLNSVDVVLQEFRAQYDVELSRLQKHSQDPSSFTGPVQSILPAHEAENRGWKLSCPHDADLKFIDLNVLSVGILAVPLKSKPKGYVCKQCSIQFVRSEGTKEKTYSNCFGALEECGGAPIVRISREIVFQAHRNCEEVLAGAMAELSIDSSSFLRLGTIARRMDNIPSHYCFDQSGEGFELPDLSAAVDKAEAAMLENAYITCKQLESQLKTRYQNESCPTTSGISRDELAEKRKQCGIRNRQLMDSDMKPGERLAILKTEFPELELNVDKLNTINRTHVNAQNRDAKNRSDK